MGRKVELLARINRLKAELEEAEREIKDLPNIDVNAKAIEVPTAVTCKIYMSYEKEYDATLNVEKLRKLGMEFGEWLESHGCFAFMGGLQEYLKYNNYG